MLRKSVGGQKGILRRGLVKKQGRSGFERVQIRELGENDGLVRFLPRKKLGYHCFLPTFAAFFCE